MSTKEELFPYRIPVTVVTGEIESGKTLLILTTGYPQERILLYDNEQSSAVYQKNFGFTRVDLVQEMTYRQEEKLAKLGDRAKESDKTWTNQEFYLAWLGHMQAIKPGTYDVIGVDPAERIESGLADWVWAHPINGHNITQYQKMSGMYWGDVKDLWGRHILEMTGKAKMVFITMHMRNVYEGNKPIPGKRERKGKDTLSELATLELELVRKPGMVLPAAKVIKTRLVYGSDPSNLKPMFDPYINPFTWDRVREYMLKGADPENLVLPPEPTEEEKRLHELELKATIAAAKLADVDTSGDRNRCPECGAAVPAGKPGHRPGCPNG